MDSGGIDWVAIAGVAGTLGGVVIGTLATSPIQKRQLLHADKTRFQDTRLDFYARFSDSANKAVAAWVRHSLNKKASAEFLLCFETIRLMASQPVREFANEVHIVFGEIQRAAKTEGITDQMIDQFHSAVGRFVNACRAELRIDDA